MNFKSIISSSIYKKNATKKWRRSMVCINAIYFIICTALAMADSSPAGFLPPAVA